MLAKESLFTYAMVSIEYKDISGAPHTFSFDFYLSKPSGYMIPTEERANRLLKDETVSLDAKNYITYYLTNIFRLEESDIRNFAALCKYRPDQTICTVKTCQRNGKSRPSQRSTIPPQNYELHKPPPGVFHRLSGAKRRRRLASTVVNFRRDRQPRVSEPTYKQSPLALLQRRLQPMPLTNGLLAVHENLVRIVNAPAHNRLTDRTA